MNLRKVVIMIGLILGFAVQLPLFIDFLWGSFQSGSVTLVYEGSSQSVKTETIVFSVGTFSCLTGIIFMLQDYWKSVLLKRKLQSIEYGENI